jgi:hypothetical protein
MNTNRRMEVLRALAAAGEKGLTMTEGRFNALEVSKLEGLIERKPGPTGTYEITEEGENYILLAENDERYVASRGVAIPAKTSIRKEPVAA